MKKKFLLLFLPILLLTGCAKTPLEDAGKLKIVASLFPQYDFAREICGDKAEVSLLLPPGTDAHSYAPTPADIVNISKADLFLYTGDTMEPWAARLVENANGTVLNVANNIKPVASTHTHHDADAKESTHALPDPHVWTNPQNAIIITNNILDAVIKLDPENAAVYKQNAAAYTEKLEALDISFSEAVSHAQRKTLFFGGHFALRHFTERYGLSYHAAYDSCAGEAEPSAAVLSDIIEKMKQENAPVVYYEELSTPRIAKLIAEETGADLLLFHSCHTLSKDEAGETYLSLMQKNLENLQIGLN